MDLFHYTFLKNHQYLDKFRNALNAPSLSLPYLNALLKTFNKNHKLYRFIVPDDRGKMTLFYKDTLNLILSRKDLINELNMYLDEWERSAMERSEQKWDDTPDEIEDTDMQKVSDKLIYDDNYGYVDESGTNLHDLYHFTKIRKFISILRDNELKTSDRELDLRNGNRFLSFTRYKNGKEGYSGFMGDLGNVLDVRFTIDPLKLNSMHNTSIHPYTKGMYLKEVFNTNAMNRSNWESEESLETHLTAIPNFNQYVKRVDIFLKKIEQADGIEELPNINLFINKIFLYTNYNDFSYQNNKCISLINYLKQYAPNKQVMENKRIHITESQFLQLKQNLAESYNFVEPEKVKIVKKYLDDNFVKGGISCMGEDGYPTTIDIVAIKGTDGQPAKNMTDKQLFYLLQDKFQKIYADKDKRDKLLKQIMKDWYYNKISKEGLLSVNKY